MFVPFDCAYTNVLVWILTLSYIVVYVLYFICFAFSIANLNIRTDNFILILGDKMYAYRASVLTIIRTLIGSSYNHHACDNLWLIIFASFVHIIFFVGLTKTFHSSSSCFSFSSKQKSTVTLPYAHYKFDILSRICSKHKAKSPPRQLICRVKIKRVKSMESGIIVYGKEWIGNYHFKNMKSTLLTFLSHYKLIYVLSVYLIDFFCSIQLQNNIWKKNVQNQYKRCVF